MSARFRLGAEDGASRMIPPDFGTEIEPGGRHDVEPGRYLKIARGDACTRTIDLVKPFRGN